MLHRASPSLCGSSLWLPVANSAASWPRALLLCSAFLTCLLGPCSTLHSQQLQSLLWDSSGRSKLSWLPLSQGCGVWAERKTDGQWQQPEGPGSLIQSLRANFTDRAVLSNMATISRVWLLKLKLKLIKMCCRKNIKGSLATCSMVTASEPFR